MADAKTTLERMKTTARRAVSWVRMRVPVGLRLPLGLLLIVMGIFGFLPILGFWMIPFGIAVAALDAKPLWQWITGRKTSDPDNAP